MTPLGRVRADGRTETLTLLYINRKRLGVTRVEIMQIYKGVTRVKRLGETSHIHFCTLNHPERMVRFFPAGASEFAPGHTT